ncbi:hypothetical protein PtA15_3A547 [Puccinia triticina]|uniref:Uncharacterized protein n=1 Tax=Puccinia triticina TaxID=208348 RepID=A0ABY7CE24_9BASI|nr:uncharacterized protein PtA15_3A547 [Puccinia triticina]WAQ83178.1 hypothetical protein PtA15_3A547 [Puccinia triticina]WAR54023.1 hypothetical protein PtB15_3B533 [Puccinia triticina]
MPPKKTSQLKEICQSDRKAQIASLDIPTHVDTGKTNPVRGLESLSLAFDSPIPSPPLPPNASSSSQNQTQSPVAYDCSQFFSLSLKSSNPSVVHTAIVAAILSIFNQCSSNVVSWFLKSQRDLQKLIISRSLTPHLINELAHPDLLVIQEIPQRIETIVAWLNLDPVLTRLLCCKKCFAMYPILPDTPLRCLHQLPTVDCIQPISDSSTSPVSKTPSDSPVCNSPLFRTRGTNTYQFVPTDSRIFTPGLPNYSLMLT